VYERPDWRGFGPVPAPPPAKRAAAPAYERPRRQDPSALAAATRKPSPITSRGHCGRASSPAGTTRLRLAQSFRLGRAQALAWAHSTAIDTGGEAVGPAVRRGFEPIRRTCPRPRRAAGRIARSPGPFDGRSAADQPGREVRGPHGFADQQRFGRCERRAVLPLACRFTVNAGVQADPAHAG